MPPAHTLRPLLRGREPLALAAVAITWTLLDPLSTIVVIELGAAHESNPVVATAIDRWGLYAGLAITNGAALALLSVLCILHWRVLDAIATATNPPALATAAIRYVVPAAVAVNGLVLTVTNLSHLV